MLDGNSAAELEHDEMQESILKEESAIAKEQMAMVTNRAKLLLDGDVFPEKKFRFNGIMFTENYSMKHVTDRFSELLDGNLLRRIYNNDCGHDQHDLIWKAAKEIAFESFDFESNPFMTLEDFEDAYND